jgi:hypothetical protein
MSEILLAAARMGVHNHEKRALFDQMDFDVTFLDQAPGPER